MLRDIILCWTWILSLLLASAFSRRVEIPTEHMLRNTCVLAKYSIRDIPKSSMYMCIRECRSRPHCHVVTFFRKRLLCRLVGVKKRRGHYGGAYTIDVRSIGMASEDIDGACANTTCPSQHQCIVSSNNQSICLMRECPTLVAIPIDGFSVSNSPGRELAKLGTVSTAFNKSCPSGGYPGPNISVQVLCKTGGWSQINDINCYACDAAVYIGAALRACYKQMTVNQTYSAAMNQCNQNGSLPTIDGPTFLREFVNIANECTWIDAKYDVGQGNWLYESGENFTFITAEYSYRNTTIYTSSMRQALCHDGVFEFRDEYHTAGTICDIK